MGLYSQITRLFSFSKELILLRNGAGKEGIILSKFSVAIYLSLWRTGLSKHVSTKGIFKENMDLLPVLLKYGHTLSFRVDFRCANTFYSYDITKPPIFGWSDYKK